MLWQDGHPKIFKALQSKGLGPTAIEDFYKFSKNNMHLNHETNTLEEISSEEKLKGWICSSWTY